MPSKEITFRTLDIGGDKVLSYFKDHSNEDNPSMGIRSIRFSLKYPDIFCQQIRAILRAGYKSQLKIMFPMISSVDEFKKAKSWVHTCMEELKKAKVPYHDNPQIGLMIEMPSVLEVLNELAVEADFFSVGTNDLVQYILAVDRTNEKVADLYLPHHPSILRALKKIVDAAQKYKKDVTVCGDMAHDEKYLKYLLGIGIRKLSVNPNYLPKMHGAIKKINLENALVFTQNLLAQSLIRDIDPFICENKNPDVE